jgi:outer membrane protein, heavy metal efflux system
MNLSVLQIRLSAHVRSRALRPRLLVLGCVCCVALLHSAPAHAAGWTIDTAEAAALTSAPSVRSAQARLKTADAYRTFGTLPRVGNPVVSVRALIGRPDDSAATYGLMLGLPFDVGGKRRAFRNEARFVSAEAQAELAVAQNDTRAEVRLAYADVMLAQTARQVTADSVATARELFERVGARVQANAATALDLALAESQYAEAQANLARTESMLVQAQNRFRQVLDLPPTEPLELAPLPALTRPDGLSLEQAVLRALAERKEGAALLSRTERLRAADRRLRAQAIGPLTAAFESEAQGNTNTRHSVGASVGFELPFVFTNQGERAVARGEANQAVTERELVEHTIAREVATALARLDAALSELQALDEHALPAAERTLAMVQTLLDSGAVDYFRLLTARANAFGLRSRRVEALREVWTSRIALSRATGVWEGMP